MLGLAALMAPRPVLDSTSKTNGELPAFARCASLTHLFDFFTFKPLLNSHLCVSVRCENAHSRISMLVAGAGAGSVVLCPRIGLLVATCPGRELAGICLIACSCDQADPSAATSLITEALDCPIGGSAVAIGRGARIRDPGPVPAASRSHAGTCSSHVLTPTRRH